jgi:hypothetical protein
MALLTARPTRDRSRRLATRNSFTSERELFLSITFVRFIHFSKIINCIRDAKGEVLANVYFEDDSGPQLAERCSF